MLKRTATGAVIVVVVYLTVYFSEAVAELLPCATALLAAAAVWELLRAAQVKSWAVIAVACVAAAAVVIAPIGGYTWFLLAVFLVAAAGFGLWMARLRTGEGQQWYIYPVCAAVVLLMKAVPELTRDELIPAITLCFVTDVAAYLVGSAFGRHKLAPVISPHKTVEGSIAGIVSAVVFVLAYGWWYCGRGSGMPEFQPVKLLLYGLSASVVAQFGDLAMSTVKRSFGVKDFGKLLPGHGGILDRFDSHIFCIAYTVLFSAMTGGLFG